ncbi:MAG: YihY/virulence factor BrkB family protein [Sterolibacterium sp.]|jgi:membrane protein
MQKRLLSRIEKAIWGVPGQAQPHWRTRGLRIVRTLLMLARDLTGGQLTLRAMGLVYTTLLSIVPLLALSFSVLKAFGVYNQIEPVLLNFLAPFGEDGEKLARDTVQFIVKINVGVVGTLGLALLVYTAISMMQKIEESLNYIWHIPRTRGFGERFSRYLSVLLVGPILVFSAMGLTASFLDIGAVREALAIDMLDLTVQAITTVMPYLLVSAAFTLVYIFVPNTRVRFGPALVGGVTGGVAWQTAGWAFAVVVASSSGYTAIYSGVAILVLSMIWLFLSWLILLFGASVAFYVQHPEYLYAKAGEPRLSNRMRERLALSVMSLIGSRFLAGEREPSVPEFTRLLGIPVHALQVVLDALERRQLIARSCDEPPIYMPARDLSLISVAQVLDTVRSAGEERFLSPEGLPAPPAVDEVLRRIGQAMETSVGDMTIRDLARRVDGDRDGRGPPASGQRPESVWNPG